MIFLNNALNLVADATIDITGENVFFPESNLYDDTLQNGVVFEDEIRVDLGSALDVNTVAIANPTKTITIEAGSDPTWVAPASLSLTMSPITGTYDNPLIALEFNSTGNWSYRYWRITASGGAYLTLFWLGQKFSVDFATFGVTDAIEVNDAKSKTQSGRFLGTTGTTIRTFEFTFEGQSKTEFDKMRNFWVDYRLRPGIWMQWEDNPEYGQPFWGVIYEFNPEEMPDEQTYTWSIIVEETK